MGDSVDRKAATQAALEFIVEYLGGAFDEELQKKLMGRMNALPSAQPDHFREVTKKIDHNADVSKKVDPIDRQAAIEAMDSLDYFGPNSVRRVLRELPSAQPEIIYCKDCKRWKERSPICNRTGKTGYGAYDFCSKGERKNDE